MSVCYIFAEGVELQSSARNIHASCINCLPFMVMH
jgi:hypothetical protein